MAIKTTVISSLLCSVLFAIVWEQFSIRSIITRFQEKPIEYVCERPAYKTRFLSYDPLIMHVEDFITPTERAHLLKIGKALSKPSTVLQRNGEKLSSATRTSSSAFIPRKDQISRCVTERAAEFQGFEEVEMIEPLQVTSYQRSQEYSEHFDWYGRQMNVSKDRLTTMFGILEADCENCGTRFPKIPVRWPNVTTEEKWCQLGILDCTSDVLVVNPLPGSALFWKNLYPSGDGDHRVLHAGMPLSRGYKTGLNIWTQTLVPPRDA